MLTIKEIKCNLCEYDERNPDSTADKDVQKDKMTRIKAGEICFCDNCFRGNTILANELVRMYNIIND